MVAPIEEPNRAMPAWNPSGSDSSYSGSPVFRLKRCTARLSLCPAGHDGGARSGHDLLESFEAKGLEAFAKPLGRNVDWSVRAGRERKDHRSPRCCYSGQLLEERDHVEEDDQVERGG